MRFSAAFLFLATGEHGVLLLVSVWTVVRVSNWMKNLKNILTCKCRRIGFVGDATLAATQSGQYLSVYLTHESRGGQFIRVLFQLS